MSALAEIRQYALSMPGAWPDEPWEGSDVVKVGPAGGGKIFCFVDHADDPAIAVKCGNNRDEAGEWLDRYPGAARPMKYLATYGWNRLQVDTGIPIEELREAIEDSYRDVTSRLPVRHRPEGWQR